MPSSARGTELFIDKMNTQNGSCYFRVAPPTTETERVATITAPARRETHDLVVDDASHLNPGQTIVITYKASFKPAIGELEGLNYPGLRSRMLDTAEAAKRLTRRTSLRHPL